MAIKDDLTWAELQAELPAGSITLVGNDIQISVSALSGGDTFAALTDSGVVELLYKLRLAAGRAQVTVNAALDPAVDTPLAAFPTFSFGIPSDDGGVTVSQTTNAVLQLDAATVKGAI